MPSQSNDGAIRSGSAGSRTTAVEVEHPVECPAGEDPVVDLPAKARLRRGPSRIRGGRRAVVARNDRGTDDAHPARLDPLGDIPHARDEARRRALPTDVVGAHEQDDVCDAGVRQDVPLEPLEPWRAGWRRPDPLTGDRVATDALVHDREMGIRRSEIEDAWRTSPATGRGHRAWCSYRP